MDLVQNSNLHFPGQRVYRSNVRPFRHVFQTEFHPEKLKARFWRLEIFEEKATSPIVAARARADPER